MLRLVACDDEPLALQRIADLVACCPDTILIEAVQDPREVLPIVRSARPDVLLLDIEMPKLRGFDLIDRLAVEDFGPSGWCPQIIIVTAHSHFASSAFESGTLDFLTKPVRLNRLELALNRARQALERQSAGKRLAELTKEVERLRLLPRNGDQGPETIWLRDRDTAVRIEIDRIILVKAEAEYVRIFVNGTSYLHREAITSFIDRLSSARFVRIHRSTIVRIDQVKSVRRSIHGALRALLVSGDEVPIGRIYRKEALRAFGFEGPRSSITSG